MQLKTAHPFTKSLFKTALECPTGLHYAKHPEKYANCMTDDEFLQSLAEGGFQVGELAKLYEHVEVDLKEIKGYKESLDKTEELLKREKVVIAEAAFAWENCFVRADIIRKNGKRIDIIEVKAKSFNPNTDHWMGKKQTHSVASGWREYIYDLAFQKYVLTHAYKDYEVHAYLMMADKSQIVDVDNLNQLFKIKHTDGSSSVEVNSNAANLIAKSQVPILTAFDIDGIVNQVIDGKTTEQIDVLGKGFATFVEETRKAWENDERLSSDIDAKCFKCPFCGHGADGMLLDGRDECWQKKAGYKPSEAIDAQISDLWGLYIRRGEWIKNGIYKQSQLTQEIMPLRENPKPQEGLNASERHWLQVAIATNNAKLKEYFGDSLQGDIYLDRNGLKAEMDKWIYPLHMIDFETTAVALPFYHGMHPYEQVAFQFSHHIIDKKQDGSYTIRHAGQYLNEDVKTFPNFEFVRELKRQLTKDKGTIFRYANHENSILNAIRAQLEESRETDKGELIDFIDSITHDKDTKRKGYRDMVDLLDIVKRYYYCYSQMHGSNSIKKVLPAVLNSSEFLQSKYSQAIYGKEIPSQNIDPSSPIAWIFRTADGTIDNPYHHLPSMATYLDISEEEMQRFQDEELDYEDDMTVANGGAALTAYSRMMFCDDKIEDALRSALLRYCELDTMAMVFIWEYFHHEIK